MVKRGREGGRSALLNSTVSADGGAEKGTKEGEVET